MADPRRAAQLRQLAAELIDEAEQLDRCVQEIGAARERLDAEPGTTVVLYGCAALLETFYTGVEKALSRVAREFGSLPRGDAWRRDLLHAMALEVPELRPRVLSRNTASRLEPFLAFRHRVRNLYLFSLDREPVTELMRAVPEVWQEARGDLAAFARELTQAAAVEEQ